MKNNFEQCLALVLKHEGGFVNNPYDPGGMTNLGVTKATWESWTGKPATEAEMKALGPADVLPLYRKQYWDKVRGDELPMGVDYVVFDCAVNAGPSRAAKILQSVIEVPSDGMIGPKTIAKVNETNPRDVVTLYCEKRLEFLQMLPTFDKFGKGWSRRVADVEATAFSMASK
jgi:lysozyme family protein